MRRTKSLARAPAALLVLVAVAIGVAWWPVTTRQGINGVVSVHRMPLWVKATEFLTRDQHYRRLAKAVTADAGDDAQAKVLTLFEWTRETLRPQPEGWPLIDDHVYSIIVRGYGSPDQFSDVLSTLCTYAGVPATMQKVLDAAGRTRYLTLVRVDGRWCPLDPFFGVYFLRPDGRFASADDLRASPDVLAAARRGPPGPVDYATLFREELSANLSQLRPTAHMPLVRLRQELAGWLTGWGRPVEATQR